MNTFIEKVHMENYKSIRNLDLKFSPNLNIIIGPNGSGKTNFLDFLDGVMNGRYEGFNKSAKADVKMFYSMTQTEDFVRCSYDNDNDKNRFRCETGEYSDEKLYEGKLGFKKIGYNLPILDFFENFKNEITYSYEDEIWYMDNNFKTLQFFNEFIQNWVCDEPIKLKDDESELKKKVLSSFAESEPISSLISMLRHFSLVKDVKIQDGISVKKTKDNKKFTLRNFSLEFLVNGEYLTWSQLSDGTKRVFTIIATVHTHLSQDEHNVIAIEEPEIGIHPQQLFLLMTFLKERSIKSQIIITTHAPEVLNFIDSHELNQIIITDYAAEEGTQMRYLTEKEQSQAKKYMENEGFLSDYWVHLNLEGEKQLII